MARRTKINWNLKDFERMRREPKVAADLLKRAEKIAAQANADNPSAFPRGAGYVANGGEGRSRDRASVVTADPASMSDAARRNGLVRALDAGR